MSEQYSIYTLTDPFDKLVHYVGRSTKPLARFGQHLQCREKTNPEKNAWIQSVIQQNQMPILDIIEVVSGSKEAHFREAYWIRHYLNHKAPLTNIIVDELREKVLAEQMRKLSSDMNQLGKEMDAMKTSMENTAKMLPAITWIRHFVEEKIALEKEAKP